MGSNLTREAPVLQGTTFRFDMPVAIASASESSTHKHRISRHWARTRATTLSSADCRRQVGKSVAIAKNGRAIWGVRCKKLSMGKKDLPYAKVLNLT
jgi:hypothetical protein